MTPPETIWLVYFPHKRGRNKRWYGERHHAINFVNEYKPYYEDVTVHRLKVGGFWEDVTEDFIHEAENEST